MTPNNATQKLRLFDGYIELRVLRTHRKCLLEIARVDAPQGYGDPFLLFVWTKGIWTFSAHLASEAEILQTLAFLQEKGVIALALGFGTVGNVRWWRAL